MKDLIRKALRESLMIQSLLTEGIDSKLYNDLIKLGLDNSFDDVEMTKSHLDSLLRNIDKLPQKIKLHRVVFVDDPKQIDNVNIGSHYVTNIKDLEQSHHQISHVDGGKPFMLTVKADKGLIDLKTTLSNNMTYPHENEITLLNKGKGAEIVDVAPFNPSNDGELDFLGSFDEFI